MEIEGKEYNFTPTYDALEAKDYNGFIGPNGEFYKVSNKNSHAPTHNNWAIEYLFYIKDNLKDQKEVRKIISAELSYKGSMNYLINGLGFIYYSHSTNKNNHNKPIIVFPKKQRFKPYVEVNSDQKRMLYKIMCVNNEYDYISNDISDAIENEKHLDYVDDYIRREIEKEQRK